MLLIVSHDLTYAVLSGLEPPEELGSDLCVGRRGSEGMGSSEEDDATGSVERERVARRETASLRTVRAALRVGVDIGRARSYERPR